MPNVLTFGPKKVRTYVAHTHSAPAATLEDSKKSGEIPDIILIS